MITFSDIQLLRGGKPLLDQASATIHPGDKVGLVGKNGCGKSTLFALMKDELSIDAGSFSQPAALGTGLGSSGNTSTRTQRLST